MVFTNSNNQKLRIGFSAETNEYYVDRVKSGEVGFQEDFASIARARSIDTSGTITMRILLDNSSVEVFGDDGVTVLTALFFPLEPYNQASLYSTNGPVTVNEGAQYDIRSIW